MNSYTQTETAQNKSGSSHNDPLAAVYQEQVKLLYRQQPYAIIASLIVAPVYTFIIWDNTKPYSAIIWLGSMLLVSITRHLLAHRYARLNLACTDHRRWENYFLAGVAASALLWGSTSLWLHQLTPVLQQAGQFFIIMGLVSGSIASLSSRPWAFRLFLVLTLLPYCLRFIYLGAPLYLALASLLVFYVLLMLPISMHIYQVIADSLQLRFKNIDLLQSYENANEYNKKANEAMFEIMKYNKFKELELEESEGFLRSILNTANDGIITTDAKGIILTANHAIERDFGYPVDELVGNSINAIMADEMGDKHDQYMQQYFNAKTPTLVGRMLDVMGKRKDGRLVPMEITVSEAQIGGNVFFTGIIRNTTDRKEHDRIMHHIMRELARAKLDLEQANSLLLDKNSELTELSEHDELTGLPNRRFMTNTFEREWSRLQRNQRPIAIILLDIDFFKRFNDSHGHQAGDACLKQIAMALKKAISRSADVIARYGGEEFIVVLPETDLNGAYHLAEKMRQAIQALQIHHSGSETAEHVTISGGVACMVPNAYNSREQLIQHADEALYSAKHDGRNCIRKHPS